MSEPAGALRDVYAALADAWCSPQDVDRHAAEGALRAAFAGWASLDEAGAAGLARFLEHPISEEEYVELFELDPRCSLYLGSHSFDEPRTCAGAAVSDRNGYMTELLGIYQHLGMAPNGRELPDYLPLMVEFLALSAESEDAIREKLANEYILPYLPPMRSRLEELESPYVDLLDILERVLRLDLEARTRVVSHA